MIEAALIGLLAWPVLSATNAGLTVVITEGSIFEDLREWVPTWPEPVGTYLGELIACPLCVSVWVGFLVGLNVAIIGADSLIEGGQITLALTFASSAGAQVLLPFMRPDV